MYDVSPIKISTSNTSKGGFVNYEYLRNDVLKRIHEANVVVTMFVDYFRMPTNILDYTQCLAKPCIEERLSSLEEAIGRDIGFPNFVPYIQKHEFEALLFSSNHGFEKYYEEKVYKQTKEIIALYPNPEDINTHPLKAPSKRIERIIEGYQKVFEGGMIALEIGIEKMMERCPRFNRWVNVLIEKASQ
ncbi:MAG: DUF4276 family protein [Bacteroides sp.]|nr:DUF4276 family protein [Bacteroides sp.]